MDKVKLFIRDVDSSVLGTCPASIDMKTGVININRDVWDRFDNFEKGFILMHEVGHYVLDTDSEYEADAYALKRVYRTAPRSLKRSLQTLMKIRVVDPHRLDALYREALTLDASDGNQIAAIEMERINDNQYFNHKNQIKMTKNRGQETYFSKKSETPKMRVVRRADGDKCGHGLNGLHLGNWYFSFTNLLLIAIVLILLFNK